MNKGQLIAEVSQVTNTTLSQAKDLVEKFSEIIRTNLLAGEEITLPEVGKLKIYKRPSRTGRNPATGEAINIPEKRVVKFVPSSFFKDTISVV